MGAATTEPDALLTWFKRQRRDWWRANWWGPVLLLVFWLFTPFGQAMLMSWHVPGLARALNRGVAVASFSPLLYPVILLIGAWLVARLGSVYSLPDDLLLTSNTRECNRAFTAILRRDAYLILGIFTFLPMLILGLFSERFEYGGLFIFVLVLGGPMALQVELSIYLRVIKRRTHIMFHTLLPSLIVVACFLLVPVVFQLLAQVAGSPYWVELIFVIPALSLVAAVVAWVLYRRSYSPRISCDSWRER